MNRPNPYNYNLPVEPAMFFGRQPDLDNLIRCVTGTPGDSAALVGGRRMGKTSLLEAVKRLLDAQEEDNTTNLLPLPIFLDFTGEGIDSTAGFFRAVAEKVETSLAELLPTPPEPFYLENRQPPAPAFAKQLAAWEKAVRQAHQRQLRLVLLLDECEQIVRQPWAAELHGALRYLLVGQQTRSLLKVVMAGSHQFLVQVQQHGSPLRNVLVYHRLAVLDREAVQALAERPSGVTVAAEVLAALVQHGGGHPFLSQYLLYYLAEQGLAQATASDVAARSADFPHERSDFWDWSLGLGDAGRQVYNVLAQATGPLSETAVRSAIQPPTPNLSQALDALCYHGLVCRQGDSYEVTAEMFRAWFLVNGITNLAEQLNPTLLHRLLVQHFNEGELQTLCLELGEDYENLPGSGKANKARELVRWSERNGRLVELAEIMQRERPNSHWT